MQEYSLAQILKNQPIFWLASTKSFTGSNRGKEPLKKNLKPVLNEKKN